MTERKPTSPAAPASDAVRTPSSVSDRGAIDAFVDKARTLAPASGRQGRLMFGLDATMSRQPTWDSAIAIQADMFREAGAVGGLEIQLIYFRGLMECRASPWVRDASALARMMERIDCRGGQTQIRKVLSRAIAETRKTPVSALVYVGDAMEEDADALCAKAGELGLLKVPMFLFQERHDPVAGATFKEMARLSGGAHVAFDQAAGGELAKLLQAVAVYAAGGVKALSDRGRRGDAGARLLLDKLS